MLIIVDDLRPALGAYGDDLAKTPNIDHIASLGVRFDRAYSQVPLCNPSRTSMLTGRYPTQTNVWDNVTWYGAAHPDFISLPLYFRQHGYHTLRAGKIFHQSLDEPEAWSEGGEPASQQDRLRQARGPNPKHLDRIQPLEGDGESHRDYQNATSAIEFLERYQNERFFLALGLHKPHPPLAAPRHILDLYNASKILLPIDFARRPTVPVGFPHESIPTRNDDLFFARDASPEEAREMIRGYYASVTFSDANVGRVIRALERLGLLDRTVIVLTSDHGFHLGEKGKWSKHGSLFDVGLRVPLIIVSPQYAHSAGKASPRVVQLLDLYGTLVDLCGLPRPSGLEGTSLRELLEDPNAGWENPAYSFALFPDGIAASIRTERWRYATWRNGESMLFDDDQDPAEDRTLARDPSYAAQVRRMRALLVQVPRWGVSPFGTRSASPAKR